MILRDMYRVLKFFSVGGLSLAFMIVNILPSQARLVFDNEFEIDNVSGDTWIIDINDDATGDIGLQFGNDGVPANNGTLTWDVINTQFEFDNDVSFEQNEVKNFVIDNRAGTSPSTPIGGQMYHDTTDGNTFVRNAVTGQWEDVTDVNSSSSKVVTVGTGLDHTTIASAATYLNGLSGGIMLLAAETHSVTAAVDLMNVTLIGKDAAVTTIAISGAGQLDSFDTAYQNLTLDVNAITADFAIDAQAGTSSLFFEFVDVDVLDSGDSLIDSSAVTAPTSTIKFVSSNQTGTAGELMKDISTGNLNASTTVFVSSSSGNGLLEISDWPVTIEGAGNVRTTGVIDTVPSDTIFVYPGMNIQEAVDSLTTGGYVTILPGTHTISDTINLTNDNVIITGYGEASIITASGFSGITATTAAIQIGAEDGSAPVDGVSLLDFSLQVGSSNIHGIRIAGGVQNRIIGLNIQKTAGTASARSAIQVLNSDTGQLDQVVINNNRILGNGGSIYFTNGLEALLDNSTFGGTKGLINAFMRRNYIDFVGEDTITLEGVESALISNNRLERMGVDGGASDSYGLHISNADNVNVYGNIASISQRTDAVGIGVEPDNLGSLSEVLDSIFTANILNGTKDSGSGFQVGFLIGNASNTNVLRSSFQNNILGGPSTLTTVAIDVRGNFDDNGLTNNTLSGDANGWDTGIDLQAAAQERNLIRGNRINNVTTFISDTGAFTRRGVDHHQDTVDPVAADDNTDGYFTGTVWVNTTSDESFISVDDSTGAAVWNQIDLVPAGGVLLDDAYNNDSGERTVTVDSGDVSWDLTGTNDYIVDIQGTGGISFQDAGTPFASFVDGGDLNLTNNLTVGASTETISNVSFSLDGDDQFISDSLGVEGAIYSDAFVEKYLWLDIYGGVRGSAPAGTVASGQSPVIRMETDDRSRIRWSFPVPDDWAAITPDNDILIDIYWSASDNTAGNVRYEFNYFAYASGETVAGGDFLDLFSTEAVAVSEQLDLKQLTFTIPEATFTAGDMVNIRINRLGNDAADTYAADINIHMARIRYQGKQLQ
jgi:hypothetical protein